MKISQKNILISVLSVLGVSTAFLGGFLKSFGFSMILLMDYRLQFGALQSVIIILISALPLLRFNLFTIGISTNLRLSGYFDLLKAGPRLYSGFKRIKFIAEMLFIGFVWLLIVFAGIFLLGFLCFVFLRLVFGVIEIVTLFFVVVTFLIMSVFAVWIVDGSRMEPSPSFRKVFAELISVNTFFRYPSAPVILSLFVLIVSYYSGVARFNSLKNSEPVCFEVENKKFLASLVGVSNDGYFYTVTKESQFNWRLALGFEVKSINVDFVAREEVSGLTASCDST